MSRPIVRPDWLTRSVQERFDAMWTPEPFSGCWLWTGAFTLGGYGRLSFNLKPVHAHRISWMLANGFMPPSEVDVCHECDVRCCVNPSHLFLGTRRDNVQDALKKGRKTYPLTRRDWTDSRELKNPLKRKECLHGHALIGSNVYISKDGYPACCDCRLIAARRRKNETTP